MTSDVSADEGLWVSLSDLARARGVTKGPLSRRISRLEEQGLLTTRHGPSGTKLVNVAEFDKVTGETTDAIREANGRRAARGRDPSDPVLAREQARKTAYQADLAKLELEERLGTLIPVAGASAAFASFGEIIVREIDHLPTFADDVAAAVAKDGLLGARVTLKRLAHDIRRAVAAAVREFGQDPGAQASVVDAERADAVICSDHPGDRARRPNATRQANSNRRRGDVGRFS